MSVSDEERKQVLGEVMMDELKIIREYLEDMPTRGELHELKADVAELKSDMKIIKAAVTDHSKQLYDHERCLTYLENAA